LGRQKSYGKIARDLLGVAEIIMDSNEPRPQFTGQPSDPEDQLPVFESATSEILSTQAPSISRRFAGFAGRQAMRPVMAFFRGLAAANDFYQNGGPSW
jgi:hypothetical protein